MISKPTVTPLANVLGWSNLIYVGVLPALGTFAIVWRDGSPENARPVVGIVGFAAVAVQLAVSVTYTRFPSTPVAMLVLLDGPAIAILSCRSRADIFDLAIRAFLVDGIAVAVALGAVASRRLRGRALLVALAIAGAMIACIAALFGPYLVHLPPAALALVGAGLAWSAIVDYRVLAADTVVRDGSSGAVIAYILGGAFLWLIAYGVGIAMHA